MGAAFGRPSPHGGGRLRRPPPCGDSLCGPLVVCSALATSCFFDIWPRLVFLALAPYCFFGTWPHLFFWHLAPIILVASWGPRLIFYQLPCINLQRLNHTFPSLAGPRPPPSPQPPTLGIGTKIGNFRMKAILWEWFWREMGLDMMENGGWRWSDIG